MSDTVSMTRKQADEILKLLYGYSELLELEQELARLKEAGDRGVSLSSYDDIDSGLFGNGLLTSTIPCRIILITASDISGAKTLWVSFGEH